MAKKKRLTRKQLLKEPDEFLTFSAKAIRFASENRKPISYVVIGIAVVAVAFAVFRYFSNLSERKACAIFEQGLVEYVAGVSGEESPHLEQTAKEKFAEVLKKYPSTSATELSLPVYADISYDEGSYDKAIELYQRRLEGVSEKDSLRNLIWNGLAYAYEGKKDYKAAAEYFRKITGSQDEFLKGEAYFNQGRMYEAMNDRVNACEAYERVVRDYPNAVQFRIAKEKVVRLKDKG